MLCKQMFVGLFFFFKQKTAYEMRISDWSSDVCSSDLLLAHVDPARERVPYALFQPLQPFRPIVGLAVVRLDPERVERQAAAQREYPRVDDVAAGQRVGAGAPREEARMIRRAVVLLVQTSIGEGNRGGTVENHGVA